jgi:cysteine desulfurase
VIVSPPPERKKVMEALESIDPSIMISSGSACTSDDAMPSHVLTAIRIPPEYIHGSVRISLGHTNTLESVLSVLCRALEKLLDGISDPNSAINTNVLKR